MASTVGVIARQHWVAIRAMIVFTVILGIAYPIVMTGIGQLAFHYQANGSRISSTGGSTLLGQSFTDSKGNPLPQWFQNRPSAASSKTAPNGYDGNVSGGSNLGPNNPTLVKAIDQRKKVIEQTYGVSASQIPADAVTASGSGLDPDISVAYAKLQIDKVASTRGISVAAVQKLVNENTHGRDLGFLGQPFVNVTTLNEALSKMDPSGNS